MHTIRTEIEIAAPLQRVWSVLMDLPGHQRWNPFVRSIEGIPRVGEMLKIVVQAPGGRSIRFRPRVLAVDTTHEFRWKGKFFVQGLFDGEHFFLLEARPDGGVRFQQGETFSGLLVPFLKSSLEGATKEGFIAMNQAIKREAEGT
jgi:hypothetical protein